MPEPEKSESQMDTSASFIGTKRERINSANTKFGFRAIHQIAREATRQNIKTLKNVLSLKISNSAIYPRIIVIKSEQQSNILNNKLEVLEVFRPRELDDERKSEKYLQLKLLEPKQIETMILDAIEATNKQPSDSLKIKSKALEIIRSEGEPLL